MLSFRRSFRFVVALLTLFALLPGLAPLTVDAQTNCPRQYIGASVVLAIDISQSMDEPAANGTKLAAAKAAASEFVGTMTGGADQLAVVTFAGPDQAATITALGSTASEQARAAARSRIGQIQIVSDDQGTDISAGLTEATRALSGAKAETNKVIILLTDGAANQPWGYASAPAYAIDAASAAARQNISIYTIGLRLGDQKGNNPELARQLLERIAEIGHGTFTPAPTGSELSQIYSAISTVIRACQVPTTPPPTPRKLPNTAVDAGSSMTFPETDYSLDGEFLSFWRTNGGLLVFGYPIDSARQANGRVAQWLERNRFELHPENATPYRVLLGRLGVEELERQGRAWQSLPKADATAAHYFAETGHAIAPQFWSYWSSHGLEFDSRGGTSTAEALALFGYPISEPRMETNADGDTVLTQWFERARFEFHPNNPVAYRVLLGLLGGEAHQARGR
jgi:Mg-chelatase subunit ChlD